MSLYQKKQERPRDYSALSDPFRRSAKTIFELSKSTERTVGMAIYIHGLEGTRHIQIPAY